MDGLLLILAGIAALSGMGVGKLARRKGRGALPWGGAFGLAFCILFLAALVAPSTAVDTRPIVAGFAYSALAAMLFILVALGRLPLLGRQRRPNARPGAETGST